MSISKAFYAAKFAALMGLLLSACPTAATAQQSDCSTERKSASLEAIIEAQLAAYDHRDVDGFLSYCSDDGKIFDHPNQLAVSGKEKLRTRYQRSFRDKDVRALLVKGVVFDRFVIDLERITGQPDGLIEAVAVYEVKDGKIIIVTFYNP